jgi:hypothetical protein
MGGSSFDSSATYISTVALADEGPFTSFKEALKNFIGRMKDDQNVRSLQIIETACWITRIGENTSIALSFYDCRDFGYRVGLLRGEDASFNEEGSEPEASLVYELYIACAIGKGDAEDFIESLPKVKTA